MEKCSEEQSAKPYLEGLEGFLSQEELNYLSTKHNEPNEVLKLMNVLLAKA